MRAMRRSDRPSFTGGATSTPTMAATSRAAADRVPGLPCRPSRSGDPFPFEGHRPLERGLAQVVRDLDGTTDRRREDPGLGGLFDHPADEDREVRSPVEDKNAMVRKEDGGDAWSDGRTDGGDRLGRATRKV